VCGDRAKTIPIGRNEFFSQPSIQVAEISPDTQWRKPGTAGAGPAPAEAQVERNEPAPRSTPASSFGTRIQSSR
jgi:hypothetical protein